MFISKYLIAFTSVVLAASEYSPQYAPCPGGYQIDRNASDLSLAEKNWLHGRDKVSRTALLDWLENSGLDDFDPVAFLQNSSIHVGLSFSGGGYRAMLSGGGQLAALDNRTSGAMGYNHFGGLLQASTYIAGLSGGSWLVTSVYENGFANIETLANGGAGSSTWQLENLFQPYGTLDNILGNLGWWISILEDIASKLNAGFPVTVTDIWGRLLSAQLYSSSSNYAEGTKFSDLRQLSDIVNYAAPYPIIMAKHRPLGEVSPTLTDPHIEININEIGSWDPSLYTFTDLLYYSSDPQKGYCVTGFDAMSFASGTSSSIFNTPLYQLLQSKPMAGIKIILDILALIDVTNIDVAQWIPSPFTEQSFGTQSPVSSGDFNLVDGGEGGENVPLQPLLQPARNVDIIFAFDNSDDTDSGWPNGTSLVNTALRQHSSQGNGVLFPDVPDESTFVNAGLTRRPTIFGCYLNNSDFITRGNPAPPLVVYIANRDWTYQSNTSTLQLTYTDAERDAMITNGYNTVTQNNGTGDATWRACAACAVILRQQQRRGENLPPQCQNCLPKYCWN